MNVDRRLSDGSRIEDETVNKSQIYVTTAGWKNSFAKSNKIIGEVKPCEHRNGGVGIKPANSESTNGITLCQAA